MPIRRVGRPGLIGLAARTAVVAGTAQAVSSRVANNQQLKAQSEQAEYATALEQAQMHQTGQASANPQPDLMAQLQQLADLKNTGMLSDSEFTAAKAKLLNQI